MCKAIKTLSKKEADLIKSELFNKLNNYIQENCFVENMNQIPQSVKSAIWYLDQILFSNIKGEPK